MATPLKRLSHCLQATVVGVDVVDVEASAPRGWSSRRQRGMERNPGFSGESGDRLAAVADERIAGVRDGEGGPTEAPSTRHDRLEGRCLPIPLAAKDGNVVLIKASMPGRSAPLSRLSRQIGPTALEKLEDEGFVRFDDPS